MNSYYSNLIEGRKTSPRDIERALANDFSASPAKRRNQLLGVAYIRTDEAMRRRLESECELDVFGVEFIKWLHCEFFSALPPEERIAKSKNGELYEIEPGEIRTFNVDVGRYTPPNHTSLGDFLERFRRAYSNNQILATNRLIAAAAAHHRLAWIHPFGDGNGRVARLQSQAALIRAGVDGGGLWTLSRGLARARGEYYRHLQNADSRRRSDLDGRGNLSDLALGGFCSFFLQQVLDQMTFMLGLIRPFDLRVRVENYLRFVRMDLEPTKREHLVSLLSRLCVDGEMVRGDVPRLLGVKDTVSREVVRAALGEGLIESPSAKGVLRISFPAKVGEHYFPMLFVDLPVDAG